MTETQVFQEIEKVLERLYSTTARANDVVGFFVRNESSIQGIHSSETMRRSLADVAKRVHEITDELESALELLDRDRYLGWLFTVPVDSELFSERVIRAKTQTSLHDVDECPEELSTPIG